MDSGLAARSSKNSGTLQFASQTPSPRPNSVTAIYRVRSSGTRAEGFVSQPKKQSVLVRETPHAPETAAAATTGRPVLRASVSTRTIPRPAAAIVRGIQGLLAPKSDSLNPQNPAKILQSGFGNFLRGQSTNHKLFRFYGQVVLPLPQRLRAWQTTPASLSSLPLKAAFIQTLLPFLVRNRQIQPLRFLFSQIFGLFRGRSGATGGRLNREFLRRLFRRRQRERWLDKMNKKRVRRISTNISRAAGKTKTADLKAYY